MARAWAPKDITGFADYVENLRPARLGAWRAGAPGRYEALAWLNRSCVRSLLALGAPKLVAGHTIDGPTADDRLYRLRLGAYHNTLGVASGWVTRFSIIDGRMQKPADQERDRTAVLRAANDCWLFRDAVAEVKAGIRGYEAKGRRVVLPYQGDIRIDRLDQLLSDDDLVEEFTNLRRVLFPTPRRQWPVVDLDQYWTALPHGVRDFYVATAQVAQANHPIYLAPDLKVAGFLVGEFNAYWLHLLARGWHMSHGICSESQRLTTVAPRIPRDRFIEEMATEANISSEASSLITTELTLDTERCPDGALTPLVPIDGDLLPMSFLITASSPQRNLIAALSRQERLPGPIGNHMGDVGARETANTLRQHLADGLLVEEQVDVLNPDGSQATDLDVLVCDITSRRLAVFEVKWDLGADDAAEVYRTVGTAATKKRLQLAKARDEMASGATAPRWPHGWPTNVDDFDKRWFVLTRNVLPTGSDISRDGITVRSAQLLQHLLKEQATFDDLIDLLDNPPLPSDEDCGTRWHRTTYGSLRVELELIDV